MAYETIEASFIGNQLHLTVGRITTNIRDNATGYKQMVTNNFPTIPEIAAIMVGDANEFLRRIQQVVDLATRNPTKYQAALTYIQWPTTEINQLRTQVTGVENHVLAADLTTAQNINNESDYILANTPQFERVF